MRHFWQTFSEKLSIMQKVMKPFYKYLAVVQIVLERGEKE